MPSYGGSFAEPYGRRGGRLTPKEIGLRRVVIRAFWIGVLVFSLFVAKAPIQLLYTVIRIWTEELRPPLLVPVKGVRASALTDTWGAGRSGGRSHEGIDIFVPCGRPVVSATEGVVWSAGENNLGGKVVFVLGPGGSFHYYAHLSRFADIGRGDHIQGGDVIGYVGNTGNAEGTSCHLHYGIYLSGRALNPYPFLAPH